MPTQSLIRTTLLSTLALGVLACTDDSGPGMPSDTAGTSGSGTAAPSDTTQAADTADLSDTTQAADTADADTDADADTSTSTGAPIDDPYRPQSGTLVLDLTDPDDAAWFMENTRPYHALEVDRAEELVYYEWQPEVGVCAAVSSGHPALNGEIIAQQLMENENKWQLGEPIEPLVTGPEDGCNDCTGITIPYFTPLRTRVTMASINIVEENLEQLFPEDPTIREDLTLAGPGGRGFIGLITRVPAQEQNGNVVPNITAESGYEFVYLRPANGDTTPGPFMGNPNSAVQYGARTFEWFVTRSQAFEQGTDAMDNPIRIPVFEGRAETSFGDTNFASLTTDLNDLEVFFDDSDTLTGNVNGMPMVSGVTGEGFDRTFLGGYTPDNSPETMNVLFVESGIYGCVQRIEMDF